MRQIIAEFTSYLNYNYWHKQLLKDYVYINANIIVDNIRYHNYNIEIQYVLKCVNDVLAISVIFPRFPRYPERNNKYVYCSLQQRLIREKRSYYKHSLGF